jgi:hypothetical protein
MLLSLLLCGAALAIPAAGPAASQAMEPRPIPDCHSTKQPRQPAPVLRRQSVAPLPGGLDAVLLVNDNNPELISGPGNPDLHLLRPGANGVPEAHLDVPFERPLRPVQPPRVRRQAAKPSIPPSGWRWWPSRAAIGR